METTVRESPETKRLQARAKNLMNRPWLNQAEVARLVWPESKTPKNLLYNRLKGFTPFKHWEAERIVNLCNGFAEQLRT